MNLKITLGEVFHENAVDAGYVPTRFKWSLPSRVVGMDGRSVGQPRRVVLRLARVDLNPVEGNGSPAEIPFFVHVPERAEGMGEEEGRQEMARLSAVVRANAFRSIQALRARATA